MSHAIVAKITAIVPHPNAVDFNPYQSPLRLRKLGLVEAGQRRVPDTLMEAIR